MVAVEASGLLASALTQVWVRPILLASSTWLIPDRAKATFKLFPTFIFPDLVPVDLWEH